MTKQVRLRRGTTAQVDAFTGAVGEIVIDTDRGEIRIQNGVAAGLRVPRFGGDYTSLNLAYTGTLTGGTGVINIGSGQVYKDASGNVTIGSGTSGNNRLVVQQSNDTGDSFRIFANGSNHQLIQRYLSSADVWQISASFGSIGAYKPIALFTSDIERFRIGTDGTAAFSSTASFAAGTAALPSISRTGDLNTGIWFPAADTVACSTNGVEALRISSARKFKASDDGTYPIASVSGVTVGHSHETTSATEWASSSISRAAATSAFGHLIYYQNSNANGNQFLFCADGTGTRLQIAGNGNVTNVNNSYGAISDIKNKEDIKDAPSYIDRFMQVRFRTFRYKAELGNGTQKQFGVVAQELEAIFPGLVDTTPDFEQVTKTRTVDIPAVEEVLDEEGSIVIPAQPATTREEEYAELVPTGTFTKSVKYSILAQLQGKVIQDQQKIIEAQQAQIDDILKRLSALEN